MNFVAQVWERTVMYCSNNFRAFLSLLKLLSHIADRSCEKGLFNYRKNCLKSCGSSVVCVKHLYYP